MEKEFEALEKVYYGSQGYGETDKYYKVVKQALLELKAIKEAKPSEAMECWKWLNATIPQWVREKDKEHPNILEPIKQALLKAQEQDKVLEILKPLCEVVETPIRKDRYLKINGVVVYTFKNDEEFDLVKRWSEK